MALDSRLVWHAAGCVINPVGLSRCIQEELNEDDGGGSNPIGGFFLSLLTRRETQAKLKDQ